MHSGTIIILNGASASGKTSIIQALQERLTIPTLEMGLERFFGMLPRRDQEQLLRDDVPGAAGETMHRLVYGMHRAMHAAAQAGNIILTDHALTERIWVDDLANLFAGLPAYLIGVRCPLDVLTQRERSRKDRTPERAAAQFPLVHRYCVYDLEVDTAILSPEQCAVRIIERINAPPEALRRLKKPQA